MKCLLRNLIAVFLFSGAALAAEANTFLVDIWETAAREDLDEDVRTMHVSLESGVMDALFDQGHVFFNIYTNPESVGGAPVPGSALELADEEGADYLLEIIPDDGGVSWRLYRTSGSVEPDGGYVAIDGIDEELGLEERWMALGAALAGDLLSRAG